uniref:Sister chromatid cohesion protein DCC1 n=1 Tax=Steinernema glaseri TaxID=37863 RepID=A0A1I8A3Z5_9BILA
MQIGVTPMEPVVKYDRSIAIVLRPSIKPWRLGITKTTPLDVNLIFSAERLSESSEIPEGACMDRSDQSSITAQRRPQKRKYGDTLLDVLETSFAENYSAVDKKSELAEKTGLSEAQVMKWFENRRRKERTAAKKNETTLPEVVPSGGDPSRDIVLLEICDVFNWSSINLNLCKSSVDANRSHGVLTMEPVVKDSREMDKFIVRRPAQKASQLPSQDASTSSAPQGRQEIELDDTSKLLNDVERVKEFFALAKELDRVEPTIQQMFFDEDAVPVDYKLVELPKDLADKFEKGEKFVLRGDADDFPVLCTEDRTFLIKEAEISNQMIFADGLSLASGVAEGDVKLELRPISAVRNIFWELTEIEHISMNRLKEILREDEMHWEESIESIQKTHTWEYLLDHVQMSEQQLRDSLRSQPTVEVGGVFRWLSSDYRDRLVNEITDLCDERAVSDVNVDCVTFAGLRSRLPGSICDQAIQWFLRDQCKPNEGEEGVYVLDEAQICRSKASQILRTTVQFNLDHFERIMEKMMPVPLDLKYEYLRGLALVTETMTAGKTVRYLAVEDLPENLKDRFQLLFSLKSPWKYSEVEPYLDDVCSSSKAKGQVLLRYCRCAKVGTEKTYYPVER